MATKTTKTTNVKTALQDAYIDYVLTHGEKPVSIYAFCKNNKVSEADFYVHFNSFEAIDKSIWESSLETTLDRLTKSEEYTNYSVREKLLAFYYTWVEELMKHRSYYTHEWLRLRKNPFQQATLAGLKEKFQAYAGQLMRDGMESNEVLDRPLIGDKYQEGLWLQAIFVLNFWSTDTSQGFEKTDAAIEKAVHLSFDLLGHSTLDSMIDFGKFLFQQRMQ